MSNNAKACGGSVSRRDFLNIAAIGGCALVAAGMAGSASASPKKFSQQQARYQPIPKSGQRCQMCALYQPPMGCQQVEGQISPAGWCTFYQAKG